MNISSDQHRKLVLRVNELFHDLEGEEYQEIHPEIFEREKRRWDRLLSAHIHATENPRTFIDIGSGTGFVGERLISHMCTGDTFICADISSKMLEICQKKFSALRPDIHLQTVKLTDEHLPLPDISVDIVTMNSVLHHVPNVELFLSEVTRITKPGGLLFIGHEPNNRFFVKRRILFRHAEFLRQLAPKRIAAAILKSLGLYSALIRTEADPFVDQMNEILKKEGLIDAPLSRSDISMLVDIHSPTAGGLRSAEGFDPFTIFEKIKDLHLISVETYNHLSKLSGCHIWLRAYEMMLSKLFPRNGATFFLIAEKR